jgi:regulator of protease activity HflC (stomatin/prohibitin superfamily)
MARNTPPPGGPTPPNFDHLFQNIQGMERNASRFSGKGCVTLAILVALFIVFTRSFIVVQAGERAVIFDKLRGVKHGQLEEGLHFNVPLLWVPIKYDIKTLTYTMSGSASEAHGESRPSGENLAESSGQVPDDSLQALTSDGLPVTLDVSVRFHIDSNNVWRLHQEIGPEFIDKVVRPQTRSITRMAIAEFSVVDVYSGKRQAIVNQIQNELKEEFARNYLVLDEVLLRDLRFPDEFQNAIEQKQVAQQQAQQMVYELDRARSEKQQKIIEAQGEAGAIREKAQALAQNPQLVQYEYIHRLPANAKILVTDSKTIINLGDFLGGSSTATPSGGQ